MENPTVGYALGILEGYLENLRNEEVFGAQEALDHLKIIEQAYIQKKQSMSIRVKIIVLCL